MTPIEPLLRFKIAQLEGSLLLYESLMLKMSHVASLQEVTIDIKHKLDKIIRVVESQKKVDHGD